jgi:hypothetical protein
MVNDAVDFPFFPSGVARTSAAAVRFKWHRHSCLCASPIHLLDSQNLSNHPTSDSHELLPGQRVGNTSNLHNRTEALER